MKSLAALAYSGACLYCISVFSEKKEVDFFSLVDLHSKCQSVFGQDTERQ